MGVPECMQKTEFRAKALKVAKSKIDQERERGKKTKTDALVETKIGETINRFIDEAKH